MSPTRPFQSTQLSEEESEGRFQPNVEDPRRKGRRHRWFSGAARESDVIGGRADGFSVVRHNSIILPICR
jgi:hypothetical protein